MNILVITDMMVPELTPEQLLAIEDPAGPGADITIATDREQALAAVPRADVIFGAARV